VTLDERPIFLVGFMGSGKSRVAEALARLLSREFVDTDGLVAEREERSIAEIFRDSGEARFRQAERQALQSLEGRCGIVVATGGGLFLGYAQRRWMQQRGWTVWLDVPLELARDRVGAGAGRPAWIPGDPVELRALFERRRAAYSLAALRIAAATGRPVTVAERVRDGLRRISD
jgi:shikimate kinase